VSDHAVLVLAGGLSHERDVSLRSGRRVAEALRGAGVEVTERDVDAGLLASLRADRPSCVVPMLQQDLRKTDTLRRGYFCQISDSTTSYGSYSGAVPNEKITWGKLSASTPNYNIESDATIVAPLIFACVLEQ